jgi:phosphate/sulfate permease
MDLFVFSIVILAVIFLVWSCVEVGSNDATNLVNAVFGSRVLSRRSAVFVAGIFVVLGASFSSPVMNTVRKGIFDISQINLQMAFVVFISVYIVGTILLYVYSLYGLPVSTTATLVFALAGSAIGASGNFSVVNWPKLLQILSAITMSIFATGVISFIFQRVFRGAIRKDSQQHDLVLLHGPWITGIILISLLWFMAIKGMKYVPAISELKKHTLLEFGTTTVILTLWALFTLFTHLALVITGRFGTKYLFHATAILGMVCMAFAFGQNDLANCASPGVTILMLWMDGIANTFKVNVPIFALTGCGVLMFLGMFTKRAQRVTRAEINTASQQNNVRLYAPNWCLWIGKKIAKSQKTPESIDIAPKSKRDADGKKLHYDSLRASVILSVGACVIAFASSFGLPVSTTYIAFAAVIGTGWSDRVYARGNADLKLARTIWVITGWFMGAVIAMGACFVVAAVIYQFKIWGLLLSLALNLGFRFYFKQKSDSHENEYHLSGKKIPETNTNNIKENLAV